MMYKFKVLAGRHTDEEGKQYNKGQTLMSEKPLDEIFIAKFERIGGIKDVVKKKPPVTEKKKDEDDASTFIPVHTSRGRWNVIDSETEEPINDDFLSKSEAAALAAKKNEEIDDDEE